MSNAFGFRPPLRGDILIQLVYNGIYRYNGSLEPVPDLAAEPCVVRPDQVTITCSLVDATFHDGRPLTADDVAFTYELGRRDTECNFGFGTCLGQMLSSATAIDTKTVEFRLSAPNATFLTLVLPSVMIDSRAVVEAAYAPLRERASSLDPEQFDQVADDIAAELESDAPECDALAVQAEGLLTSAGLELLPRNQFNGPDGNFDACLYADTTAIRVRDVAASLRATGLDAIALAYRTLSFNQHPIGTGPWRFVSVEDGTRGVFEAFDGYHLGPPATSRFEVRVIRAPNGLRDGLLNGEIDWATLPPGTYEQVKDVPGLQFANYADPLIYVLAYNVRQGQLFADHALRSAIELCIDKPATVDAATGGSGDVIYSPIDPISWAFQPDLRHPERNVSAARGLIEAAGWTSGTDGIYVRGGKRLAADIYVRADEEPRVRFVDLLVEQVRDCGIELTAVHADANTVLRPLGEWPHIPGGSDKPFEAVFLAFTHGFDPHDELFASWQVSSEDNPHGANFMGFASAKVDQLLNEGVATYDQRERARIYRQLQETLADEQPVLFAWADRRYEALDSRLRSTDGPIDLTTRQWWWQLEKLTLLAD
jgi:ABC-type transport system substrate-binding protein